MQSFQEIYDSQPDVYCAPISIRELHEFLSHSSKNDRGD